MNPDGLFQASQIAIDCVCAAMDDLAADDDTYPGCPTCLSWVSVTPPAIDCCDSTCDGGMLTAHIENVYASDAFPNATEEFAPCKAGTWVGTLVITIARCSPQGEDATPENLSAVSRIVALDTYAALTALGCCLVADTTGLGGKRKRRVQIIGMTPVEDSGGCVSVEVRAFVELGRICGCSSES